jgi:transcriptional regulator with XRE-family HTH domain
MRAIAKAMGFPPEMWFEEDLGSEGGSPPQPERRGIPGRVKHLFDVLKNPKTGQSYTNAQVARMSAGEITEEEVEGIRTGKIADPSVSRIAALAAVFGVPPSYVLDRGTGSEVLDEETLKALADKTAGAILSPTVPLRASLWTNAIICRVPPLSETRALLCTICGTVRGSCYWAQTPPLVDPATKNRCPSPTVSRKAPVGHRVWGALGLAPASAIAL